MSFLTLLLTIAAFCTGIRSDLEGSTAQEGRTFAAEPAHNVIVGPYELDFAKKSQIKPLSMPVWDSCTNAIEAAYGWEQNYISNDIVYDTVTWFMNHCYKYASASETWGAFGGSLDSMGRSQAGRDSVTNFAIYALGLRSDNEWFCYGVPYVAFKYGTWTKTPNQQDSNFSFDYRANRAIAAFLWHNPRCAFNIGNDSEEYYSLLEDQESLFSDTGHKGDVFDSTMPTLQDLGLDTLLKLSAGVSYVITTSSIILDARLVGNPTSDDGLLWLSIGREAWLNIGVYDVLGRTVPGSGYGGVFEQGTREVPIGMSGAPPGTYYVRIQTANNETRTLKLLKQ